VSLNGAGVSSHISIDGLDGRGVVLDGGYQVPSLPRIGPSGAIVDLARILRLATGPVVHDAVEEVWLSSTAGPSIRGALRAQGLSVIQMQRAADTKRNLDESGLALAYQLLVFASLASLLLAVGASAFNVLTAAPRRAHEVAVLRAVGIPDGALVRGLFGEQMLVLGIAALVGLATGVAAALITLPVVPEIAGDPLMPLQFQLPIAAVAGLAVLLIATAAGIALLGAMWVLRLAAPIRLRLALV
jgi:predicted lysophospholipase L1 biosynthesis ABC-type transport system permease subunit